MFENTLPDFKLINNGPFSRRALDLNIQTYHQLVRFIADVPYGRIASSGDLMGVFDEARGTCSTKHALLKSVADENNYSSIKLIIGIYNMNQNNTPGIGDVLAHHGLDYMPEAHCYLRYLDVRTDVTTRHSNIALLVDAIQVEHIITPKQITAYKVELHRAFLKKWCNDSGINKSLKELWVIRELCIVQLSKNN